MRVLVLTITAGEGHNTTAAAIKEGMDARGTECKLEDLYKLLSPMVYTAFSEGYLFITKHMKGAYGKFYASAENRKKNADTGSAMRSLNYSFAKDLKKYIDVYDPDVILFTHVMIGVVLDQIKVKWGLRAATIGIVTDYRLHPYWEESLHLDYVVCADKRMSYRIREKGFSDEQILPFGIPVQRKFLNDIDKKDAREELGLDDKPTVLIMGGSMGFGNIVDNVKKIDALENDLQMIIVCGSNKKLYDELSAIEFKKNAKVFGYVNNVEVLMSASDCIVTKPGGLTTSEALVKRLPMIIVNPISGHEDRNVEFFLNNGAAIFAGKTFGVDEAVWLCVNDEDRLNTLKSAIEQIRHPDALDHICDFALEKAIEKSNK